jgi:thymidylate kinase
MWNTGRFITFDWPDGVGKTTIAMALAEKHNGVYYRTPGSAKLEERRKYDSLEISTQERLEFYTKQLKNDAARIRMILEGWTTVFCDRYMISTIVHHKTISPWVDTSEAEKILQTTKPDCTIIIHGNVNSLMERVLARESQTRFELDRNLVERTQRAFLSYADIHAFDNTDCSIDETVGRITRRLQNLLIL